MKNKLSIRYVLFSIIFLFYTQCILADGLLSNPNRLKPPSSISDWQQITLPSTDVVRDPENPGQMRTIQTGCAFSYQNGEAYKFYYKPGDDKRLLIYFNGGGACWDNNTCLASLKIGPQPTYNPTITQNNDPVSSGGILDTNNIENPFKDYSMVFLPYCTGDIHIGSKNTVYTDTTGLVTGVVGTKVPVMHRGFDNFLGVRKWIKRHFGMRWNSNKLDNVLVAGSSAGGYGATFNFPYVADIFPGVNINLIADASASILTQDFLDKVFTIGGPWGMEDNLTNSVPGLNQLGNYDASNLNVTLITALASFYPNSHFGQYTSAWDAVQTQFLKIMQNPNDPQVWNNLDLATFCEWNARMEQSFNLNTSNSNYRFYIGAGTVHMGLIDVFAPNRFISETSGGEPLPTWVSELADKNNKNEWFNRQCTDCEAPFPVELCASQ